MSGMDMYAQHESPAGLAMMIGTGYGEGGEGGGAVEVTETTDGEF
jgi:hypothetical protein